jgi:hypothetical protein
MQLEGWVAHGRGVCVGGWLAGEGCSCVAICGGARLLLPLLLRRGPPAKRMPRRVCGNAAPSSSDLVLISWRPCPPFTAGCTTAVRGSERPRGPVHVRQAALQCTPKCAVHVQRCPVLPAGSARVGAPFCTWWLQRGGSIFGRRPMARALNGRTSVVFDVQLLLLECVKTFLCCWCRPGRFLRALPDANAWGC